MLLLYMLEKKSFPPSHGNIHTYTIIPVNKNMAHNKIYNIALMKNNI